MQPPSSEPPWVTLDAGSTYFAIDGNARPLFLRNITASSASDFGPMFKTAKAAGTDVARLQLTQGFGYENLGITQAGKVAPGFDTNWTRVIESAQATRLGVIPVFGIWGDWNSGDPDLGWSHFDANPLNAALGGPASNPADLFAAGPTQDAWLGWLAQLVQAFAPYSAVVAWEVFSELDLATGSSESLASDFFERAAQVIRDNDPLERPVFASTSDLPLISGAPWQQFWQSAHNSIISLHTYDGNLDATVIDRVKAVRASSAKPILLAESGLDAASPLGNTLSSAPRAQVGLDHAIWAELFSGSASARALYWEDGYAAYFPETGMSFVRAHDELESVAAVWVNELDFSQLTQTEVLVDGALAVTLASTEVVVGWLRAQEEASPDWPAVALGALHLEIVTKPGAPAGEWDVEWLEPHSGADGKASATATDSSLSIDLQISTGSVAYIAHPH